VSNQLKTLTGAEAGELMRGTCRGCGRPVVWLIDTEGKNQILDPTPPVFIARRNGNGEVIAQRTHAAFVSHFSTCPKADQFSGRNKKAPK
jgi:hypothetical protein